jgi:hypothetical protein
VQRRAVGRGSAPIAVTPQHSIWSWMPMTKRRSQAFLSRL